MIKSMYPFWSAILSALLAQLLKPIIYYIRHRKWKLQLLIDSGGMPSSHTALVSALAMSVGLQERFSSTIFAVTMALAVIVIYDAANVRYYSGQNIRVTQQLVKDVQENLHTEFDDPIYQTKLKEVLGHKWKEIFGGLVLGIIRPHLKELSDKDLSVMIDDNNFLERMDLYGDEHIDKPEWLKWKADLIAERERRTDGVDS